MGLDELYQSDKINDYFYNKLRKSVMMHIIEPEDLEGFLDDIQLMSEFGVSSKNDEQLARAILLHVSDVILDIKDENYEMSPEDLKKLYLELFNNKELLKTTNVFCTIADAAKKVNIPLGNPAAEECDVDNYEVIEKAAYPQGFSSEHILPQYDIERWMRATRDIYNNSKVMNKSFHDSFLEVTSSWDKVERLKFKHWLDFFKNNNHLKYSNFRNKVNVKTAQYHSQDGLFLPQVELPQPQRVEQLDVKQKKPDQAEVRDKIENQRSKIISRLTSAEKLLSSMDGQFFAGDDQEVMLKLLQDLKRKVQTANKITVKSSLFEDLIYRAGNMMRDIYSSKKGQGFFYKVAQNVDPFAPTLPSPGINSGQTPQPASGMDIKTDTQQAFREFEERWNEGTPDWIYDHNDDFYEREWIAKQESKENQSVQPQPKAQVQAESDFDIVVTAQDMGGLEEDIQIGEAEFAPEEDRPRQERQRLPPEQDISVSENDTPESKDPIKKRKDRILEEDSDDIIEAALNDITIYDAIARLEILVGIYKKREVPRQMAILDIMMDSLGLTSYFPSLGEAMGKALESSQYISTRLEDVLNKLKGSIESKDGNEWVDYDDEKSSIVSPETEAVKNTLDSEQQKEEERKRKRKEKENEKLDKGNKTEVGEQAEQLAQPASVESGKPISVR